MGPSQPCTLFLGLQLALWWRCQVPACRDGQSSPALAGCIGALALASVIIVTLSTSSAHVTLSLRIHGY